MPAPAASLQSRRSICAMRIALVTLVAALAAIPGWASASPAGSVTGLHGVVSRGPVAPICIEIRPCIRPSAGVTVVFSRAGVEVGRATTGQLGRYSIHLRAGIYSVRTARKMTLGGLGGLSPRVVRVVAGRMSRVDFSIDIGIR